MLMYSRPAARTASAARNGWGSIGSRAFRISPHPARLPAGRMARAGAPPATPPGNGASACPTPPASPLTVSIADLFVRLTHQRWPGTVGQFRVPFALESLLSSGFLETTERSRIVTAARRDIGAQLEWRIPDRVTLQGAVVNGEGPNRAVNPDNRMAYFARAVVTPVTGLDVGGAFAAHSDSAEVDGQVMYRTTRGVVRAEYIRDRNRRDDVHTVGWYALAGYIVAPRRVSSASPVVDQPPCPSDAPELYTP